MRGGEGDKSIRVDQPPHLEVFERVEGREGGRGGGVIIHIAVACQIPHLKSERGQSNNFILLEL